MAQRILRPLDYGDIFDEMFDLYKRRFVVFVGIAAVIHIPINAVASMIGGQVATVIGSILNAIMSYVVLAATTYAVSQCYLGKETSIAESYKAVGRKIIPFMLTMVAVGILIGVGFLLLIVPGVILAFRYAFISEVYILEGKTGKEARTRSAFLAKDNISRIFVVSLLTGILAAIISGVLTAPVQILVAVLAGSDGSAMPSGPLGLLVGVVTGIATALTTPLQVISFVLLYYDLRVRKDGFDIEMLAASMGASAPAPPALAGVTSEPQSGEGPTEL